MAGILINTRVPKELHADITRFVRIAHYGDVQEFTREALREHLRQRRLDWGLQELDRLRGSAKGNNIRVLTPAQRDALAMKGGKPKLEGFILNRLERRGKTGASFRDKNAKPA